MAQLILTYILQRPWISLRQRLVLQSSFCYYVISNMFPLLF